jgi:hypothetical protein
MCYIYDLRNYRIVTVDSYADVEAFFDNDGNRFESVEVDGARIYAPVCDNLDSAEAVAVWRETLSEALQVCRAKIEWQKIHRDEMENKLVDRELDIVAPDRPLTDDELLDWSLNEGWARDSRRSYRGNAVESIDTKMMLGRTFQQAVDELAAEINVLIDNEKRHPKGDSKIVDISHLMRQIAALKDVKDTEFFTDDSPRERYTGRLVLDDGEVLSFDAGEDGERRRAFAVEINGQWRTHFKPWEDDVSSGSLFMPDPEHPANATIEVMTEPCKTFSLEKALSGRE